MLSRDRCSILPARALPEHPGLYQLGLYQVLTPSSSSGKFLLLHPSPRPGTGQAGFVGGSELAGGVGGTAVPPRMGEPLASQPPAAPKTTGGSRWAAGPAPAPSRGKWKAGRVLSTVSCAAGSFSCPAETAEERWEVTSASCAKRRSDDAMADTKAALTGPGHLPPSHARGIHGCRAAQSTRWDQRDGPGAAPARQGAEEPRLLPGAALRCHRPGPAAPCGTGRKLCPVLALPWHG